MAPVAQDFRLHVEAAARNMGNQSGAAQPLVDAAKSYDAAVEAIHNDADLNDEGRQRRLGAAREEVLAKVETFRQDVLAPRELVLQTLQRQAEAEAAPRPVETVAGLAEQMRHAEIRRSLEGVDVLELQARWDELPQEVQAALRSAPPVPVVHDDGSLRFVSAAPPAPAPSSPELQTATTVYEGLSRLAGELRALVGGTA